MTARDPQRIVPMPLTEMVNAVREGILSSAGTTLGGTVLVPPQAHLFTDGPGYAGCVVTRDFDRGEDAAWAIAGLGFPLATLPASRALLMWEQADLLTSLNAPEPATERALVFLDATTDDYRVTWYPFELPVGPGSADVTWFEPRTADRPALPKPIIEVLRIWREPIPDDFASTMDELQQGGYKYLPVGPAAAPLPGAESIHSDISAALATCEPAAVERATQGLRGLLTVPGTSDDEGRGLLLVLLSMILQLRYEVSGDLDDAAEAVQAARDAASYPDQEETAMRFNTLGTALRVWYGQTGDAAALSEAIAVGSRAAGLVTHNDPNYGTCMANFAWALHTSFLADGDAATLDAAVSAGRQALASGTLTGANREVGEMSMGVCLHSKYFLTGELAVLDEAIELGRSALADSASTGWTRAARLTNLGRSLEARYLRTGDLGSLREAVRAQRRAVAVAPPDHADRRLYQLNLSGTLRALFDRIGDHAILDEAFTVARGALKEIPAGHPFRVNHRGNLAAIHLVRYQETASVAELVAAQALLREALAEAGETHPQRPVLMSALAEVIDLKARHTSEFGQLDEAIKLGREALGLLTDGHPSRAAVLRTLAEAYGTRHQALGDQAALAEAIRLFQAAAADRTAPIRGRVDAARRWGSIAASAGLTEVAFDGLAAAVELLPQFAARSLHRYDSEYGLSQYGGLASDAAALALELDRADRAIELLELGRTVLMAKALEIRTDLSALRDRDPRLADRFEWLSVRLESDERDKPDSRRALADELDAVIAAARALPGLDRFLLPPKVTELLAQAGQGPIAVVNVSAYRCDALVLTENGLLPRPLPHVTADAVSDHVNRFLTTLRTDCESQLRQVRERGDQTLTETLSWLWDSVCAPVLDTADPAPGQRIWWIPTGLLGFLPLHAAGGRAPGESTLDRVVSSYTPSVRTLSHARATAGSRPCAPSIVVAMPHTPDDPTLPDLPGVLRESRLVASRVPDARTLTGPDATRDTVTAALQESAWAHFACHALTAASPSDSRLALYDHDQQPLTAATVSSLRLDRAAFAYLSACRTAVPTAHLADEVIHIASAFHIAGYPHVIGTLWAVEDRAAATIAELVYDELTDDRPDPGRAPLALHNALTQARKTHPHQPSLWASHIHIGI